MENNNSRLQAVKKVEEVEVESVDCLIKYGFFWQKKFAPRKFELCLQYAS